MSKKESLPLKKQIAYATGQLGWSTLINIIGLQLVYFYIPPDNSGLPYFIIQIAFLGILNAISLIAAAGRLFDAITDPLIASLSDRSTHKMGRRIPFLLFGAVPAALFCTLMFVPPVSSISVWNIVWLVVIQFLFYFSLTCYVTPFFALLPELGHTADERLNLSTWISITYALGIILAAQTPGIASALSGIFSFETKAGSIQAAVGILSFFSIIFMMFPVIFIDEQKYCESVPSETSMLESLKKTFRNRHFVYYVVADFSYFYGLTIVMSGLLYYITVLLGLEEALTGQLLALMVIISFLFYPFVNILAKKLGKKSLIIGSFFFMSVVFAFIYFLGRFTISNNIQAYLLAVFYAIPISFLGILPNAVLADIAEHDALKTGQRQEGMFFAARTLMQKFGQTFGILTFAALTTLGKDPGNDLGIRMSGTFGFILCLIAGIFFLKYNEKQLLTELTEMGEAE